ncbi:MAG TPA: oligosaccharide flippase family protein [Thermoleophilaceae bacterium]|nr:oligosaccharide flippase family protein [Thermoleophilaceae bacterium]
MILKLIRRWLRRLLGRPARAPERRARRRSRAGRAPSALGTFGTRIGRHAGIYGAGQAGSLMLGLVTVAVLTRLLPPAEFGVYALYYVLAALLATLYTLGLARGGMLWVFGSGGGDDEDADEADEEDDTAPRAGDKRRALGTALLLVAGVAALGSVIVAVASSSVSSFLTGESGTDTLTLLAGLAGAAWAIALLAGGVPRRERRPYAFVFVSLARPLLVLAATVPLVVARPEVESAVLGLAIGTGAAAIVALGAVRRSWRLAFGFEDARNILRLGARYVPLLVALWVIANGGVFLLGVYGSTTEAGFFRLAVSVAAGASLPTSAFISAWGPMRREPIFGAVEAERGKLAANGVLATYFALAAIWIALALWISADLLVQIAPGAYAEAAPLIPLLGLGFLLQGWFRVMKRTSRIPRRWVWYVSLAVLAAFVFVATCVMLIPSLGAEGAALALVAAFGVAAAGMSLRSQAGSSPVPLAYGRLAVGFAIAAGCALLARPLAEAAGSAGPVVDAAALLLYPVLLVATGTIPRAHLTPLGRMVKAAAPGGGRAGNGLVELGALSEQQRALLEILIRHRRPPDAVAPVLGSSRDEVAMLFVAALRQLAGVGTSSPTDARLGSYLLSTAPIAARDQLWRRLASEGVDALEVDALSLTLERLRRAPEGSWTAGRNGSPASDRGARAGDRQPRASDRPSHAS